MELINFDRIHWQLKVNYGATTELVDNLIDTGFGDFPEEVIQIGKSIVAEYVSGVLSVPQNPIRGKLLSFIKSQGAYYILTNAAHQTIRDIFTQEDDIRYEFSRASLIGGENATRGKIKEYIFTNIKGGVQA